MKITNYIQATKYLEGFIGKVRFEITPEFLRHHDPLERMRVLLFLLGNPQDKFKSILVGGTSGKGSTAFLISHILTTAGYKTGLTISPHLQKINERLQINGKPISDKEFTNMVSSIVDTIELMKKMPIGGPSYFEILIAMAFLYFVKEKVDIVVVEVGMGGEFDATNTLYPLVAVLTNVSLDHTNVLGGTVEKIAKTKAGIIKDNSSLRSLSQFGDSSNPNINQSYSLARAKLFNTGSKNSLFKSSPHAKAPRELKRNLVVITGVKQPSVIKIVENRCREAGARVFRLYKDFDFKIKGESLEGSVFDLIDQRDRVKKLNDLTFSLLGGYQIENASLAIETVLQLKKFGFKVSEEHIREALKTAFFPGRFEIISLDTKILRYKDIKRRNGKEKSHSILISQYPNITIVLDGAHNPTKMKAFLTSLKSLFPKQKKIFIVGFKFDKDIPKMLSQITKIADTIIVTEFDRATDMAVSSSVDALNIKNQLSSFDFAQDRNINPFDKLRVDAEQSRSIKYNKEIKVIVEKDSKKALDKAINLSAMEQFNNETIVVITGSLYLVGEVRNML